MRIRCERCATTYELDDKRLPPHGALVKCTRCDHVFRAAPPAPRSASTPPGAPEDSTRPTGEERTALFGFSAPAGEEQTANLAAAPPPGPATTRRREAAPARGAGGSPVPGPARSRSPWPWVIVAALLLALAIAAGWFVVQSRVATPTTRLPAGVVFLPT